MLDKTTKGRFSQSSEEAVVEGILEVLGVPWDECLFIEFGASTGVDNSNFLRFALEGAPLVMIEPEPSRFRELASNLRHLNNVDTIQDYVGFSHDDNLLTVLTKNGITPRKYNLVSIDIDGDDAAVYENLGLQAAVAIVEFNPTMPSDVAYRQPAGRSFGNSPGELLRVAKVASMIPVAVASSNIVFVHDAFAESFTTVDIESELSDDRFWRFAWAYDGTLVRFRGDGSDDTQQIYANGWNRSLMSQPLPAYLRRFPSRRQQLLHLLTWVAPAMVAQPISTLRAMAKFGRG